MAQTIEEKLRRINEILEDDGEPFVLKTEIEDEKNGGFARRFFLSWPDGGEQELCVSYTVGGVYHWLDGVYHGMMMTTTGHALDFPPNEDCLTCGGRGYCECQVDKSAFDQNAHLPKSRANRTIQQIVATINDPDVVGHWDDAFDGIWEILHDAGYPVVVNEGE